MAIEEPKHKGVQGETSLGQKTQKFVLKITTKLTAPLEISI